jgi:uncharacterized protein YecE (DUF72 family)
VEINSSFYHMPNEKTTSKWAGSTQENFRFSFKVNRRITHIKKLRNVAEDTLFFVKALNPLEHKIGCVLVQLPPFMKQDYPLLETFLNKKPDSVRVALEFRHSSWFSEDLSKLLSKHNAALCVADREEMKPAFQRTSDFTYVRLRQDHYSDDALKMWAKRLFEFAKGASDCFVYFKHDEAGEAANVAMEFGRQLQNLSE